MMIQEKAMTEDSAVHVERISQIYVRGNEINGTFDVGVSDLDWTEDDATEFLRDVCDKGLDLHRNNVYFETLSGNEIEIGPAKVVGISLWWKRQLKGREPRERLEKEFAARRQDVLALLNTRGK